MKSSLLFILLVAISVSLPAQNSAPQQGTIIRMRMTDCMGPQHGFMAAMSGGGKVEPGAMCPEYVLMAERVVYVITGKSSESLLPMAEITKFHFRNNEMLIRIDDARKESRFRVKAMVLRPDWDRNQQLEEAAASEMARHHLEMPLARDQ